VTQEVVVLDWTSGTSIDAMIKDVLHAAAEKMPHFTEDHWAVATFLRAQRNQSVILRITKEDLSQCGSEFQTAIMDATLLAAAENLNLRLSSFPIFGYGLKAG
jgi:hypothetical protein